ncbi:DUF4832 domain-containing protein [Paenibacillus sp. Soil724D2]|uniref:DUF4832 domain-containing protein n=1 Tax=Paenibacillus sp. (strain Soil724D2) TaxID=1736392 RepID=UPI000714C294|nr:DUF4832 domain-containing protein [Paenibacillus sp. Soil724D2]KRE40964.1 beta-galactosidase [Paenibacillus sp. Soil724D2]
MKRKYKVIGILTALSLMTVSITLVSAEVKKRETIKFSPTEIGSVLNNPYMGFAPDARWGPYQEPHRLVFFDFTWRELEAAKGIYAFDKLEEKNQFKRWKSENVKIIFRLILDDTSDTSHMDIPDWLYEEIGEEGSWYNTSYGKGFSPNYENKKLIEEHRKLIQKLGERYNHDARIAFVEVGSVGHWGEWHTKSGQGGVSEPFPKAAVTDQYVEAYLGEFPDKPLLMRRPHEIAKSNHLGLFNDVFGDKQETMSGFINWIHNGYTSWLTEEKMPAMPEHWIYAPSGGEFAYSEDENKYIANNAIDETIAQARESHTTWLGPNLPSFKSYKGKYQGNVERLLNTMGYRYVLKTETHQTKVKPNEKLVVNMVMENKGVAPFYFNWPLELSLADAEGKIVHRESVQVDIRSWLPGIQKSTLSLKIPATIPIGKYTLCVGIIDPESGNPGIELAIQGKREDGRYSLGIVNVQ